jgi:uncharacterized protein YndB with AHSA1/START domain
MTKIVSEESNLIKKEIVINSSVERVFSALINPEQLTQWFPDIVMIEPKLGGKVSFKFLKENTKEEKDHEIVGTIVSIIPNKELSYTWNFITKPEYSKCTMVTWKVDKLESNKTKITLIHSGFTKEDALQYKDHIKGWTWHINRLDNLLATSLQD